MEEIVKKLMIPISNQIKKIIHQQVVAPVYNDNMESWLIAVRVKKPIYGSVEILLIKPQKEELPIISFEIFCVKRKEVMSEIFDKIIKLIDNKIYKIITSENFIGLHWHVHFNSKNETEIDFVKFSRLLPRILILLKDLGLFKLRSNESIVNSTTDKYFRNNIKKNCSEKSKIKYLIRRFCPAIIPHSKNYYYYF